MIERNQDLSKLAHIRLSNLKFKMENPKLAAEIEIAWHAYQASPTANHYDHLWGLLQ